MHVYSDSVEFSIATPAGRRLNHSDPRRDARWGRDLPGIANALFIGVLLFQRHGALCNLMPHIIFFRRNTDVLVLLAENQTDMQIFKGLHQRLCAGHHPL